MEEKNWAKVENDTVGKFFGFEIEKRRTRMTRRAVPGPNHTIFSNAVIERGFVTICQSDSGLMALSKVLLTGTFSLFNWHAELCYHFTWMVDFFLLPVVPFLSTYDEKCQSNSFEIQTQSQNVHWHCWVFQWQNVITTVKVKNEDTERSETIAQVQELSVVPFGNKQL